MDTKTPYILTSKYLPTYMETLTPEIIRKAEDELGETPEATKEALKELRKLIKAEEDFEPLMEDAYLLRFLRSRKFDTEDAFKTLKNYYTFKVRYSRVLTEYRPSELMHVFNQNIMMPLAYRDPDGCFVGVGKLGVYDLDKGSVDDLFASIILCAEYLLKFEATQICGVVLIIDLKGLNLRLARHLASPTLHYRLVRAMQHCLPVRIKAVHIINEPFFFSAVINLFKRFLSEKIRNRFQFHGSNLSSLHKKTGLPPAILPKEMGGELGLIDSRDLVNRLLENEGYFLKVYKYGFEERRASYIRRRSSTAYGLFL